MEAEQPTQMPELLDTTTPSAASSSSLSLVRSEKPERNLWREQEMLTVLQIIREHNFLVLLNDKTVRSETVFRNIEKEMINRGLRKKNFQQIWTKWKFLKSTYMTSRRIHQIPKIIPLDVYESLDELLSAEFRNDGSVSSYDDGGDYDDVGGMSSYEMMNSCGAARTPCNDGLLVISNVQGGVVAAGHNGGGRNVTTNGFAARKLKKNGLRLKKEEETNGFGMQHPIFGYRLGVVKDEPIDDDYDQDDEPYSDIHLEEPLDGYPQVKEERLSPPHSTPPPEEDHLLPAPVIQMPPILDIPTCSNSHHPMINGSSHDDQQMPPLHTYTPSPFQIPRTHLPVHPPPLKQKPLMKITLPPKPPALAIPQVKSPPPSMPKMVNSKKIPVLTIRKRKKRLNIPQLSDEGTNSPVPSAKLTKLSEESDSKEAETTRIPFVTYGKAMREMSTSLRDIQREMIDDFFKQQMELAKSEHEFQKQQDAILLRCFEEQTKMLLEGAKKLFTTNSAVASNAVYIDDE